MPGFVISLNKKKTIVISCIVALIFLLLGGTIAYCNILLSSPNIYDNIYVNDVNIGGMSVESAKKALESKYIGFTDDKSINLVFEGASQKIDLDVLNIKTNIDTIINNAFNFARCGNSFDRVNNIIRTKLSKVVLPLEIEYDDKRLNDNILAFASVIDKNQNMFEIDEKNESLKIDIAKTNKLIDIAKTKELVVDNIKNASFQDVTPVLISTNSPKIKAELLYNRIAREPLDATMTAKGGVITYIDEHSGIEFDKNELEKAFTENKGEITLKIKVTKPQITVEKLKNRSFVDTLASFSTNYDGSIAGRTQNVRLAAQKINNYIIPPGGEFSFNKVVGRRTVANGFAMGKIFVGDDVVDDVGGGICQVSSTLYTCVLKANLNVVERHNHKFAVTYAPKGQDATVSYGALDFRFTNNTKYPIKVLASANGGRMSASLVGTQQNPGQTIEILNIVTSTKPFEQRQKENPDPSITKKVTQQGGMNGATVESYKIIKQNGAEVSRTFLHTSVYVPMDRVILIPKSQMKNDTEQVVNPTSNPEQVPNDPQINPTPKPSENPDLNDSPIATLPPTSEPVLQQNATPNATQNATQNDITND